MKNYYECHVAMLGNPAEIRSHVEKLGWKFSAIDGDPVLGGGVKCYATMLYSKLFNQDVIVNRTKNLAKTLENLGFNVLRRKVELVVFDDRNALAQNACDTGCCEVNG